MYIIVKGNLTILSETSCVLKTWTWAAGPMVASVSDQSGVRDVGLAFFSEINNWTSHYHEASPDSNGEIYSPIFASWKKHRYNFFMR